MSKKQFSNLGSISKNIKIKPVKLKTTTSNRVSNSQLRRLEPKDIASIPGESVKRGTLLRLKTNRSWEITPTKLKDKDMEVVEFYGKFQLSSIDVYPENVYWGRVDAGRPGYLPESRQLVLRFQPQMGKRYRVVIKLKPDDYTAKSIFTSVTGRHFDKWLINNYFNEVLFDFVASTRQIKISSLYTGSRSMHDMLAPLPIKKINVDLVED